MVKSAGLDASLFAYSGFKGKTTFSAQPMLSWPSYKGYKQRQKLLGNMSDHYGVA